MADFGLWLRNAMDDAGITSYAEVARRIGVTQPTVNRWANNKTRPRSARQRDLARVLGLTQRKVWEALNGREPLSDEEYQEWIALYQESDPEIRQEGMEYIRFRNRQRQLRGETP